MFYHVPPLQNKHIAALGNGTEGVPQLKHKTTWKGVEEQACCASLSTRQVTLTQSVFVCVQGLFVAPREMKCVMGAVKSCSEVERGITWSYGEENEEAGSQVDAAEMASFWGWDADGSGARWTWVCDVNTIRTHRLYCTQLNGITVNLLVSLFPPPCLSHSHPVYIIPRAYTHTHTHTHT